MRRAWFKSIVALQYFMVARAEAEATPQEHVSFKIGLRAVEHAERLACKTRDLSKPCCRSRTHATSMRAKSRSNGSSFGFSHLSCAVNGISLHLLAHVRILDHSFRARA